MRPARLSLAPGAPVDGFCVGEVIESRNERFVVGDKVALSGWASHVVSNGRGYCVKTPDLGVPEQLWIGLLGVPGMTAWWGLMEIGKPKAGETLPAAPYGTEQKPSAEALLKPTAQAAPERSVELRKRSEERTQDPFDLPPSD